MHRRRRFGTRSRRRLADGGWEIRARVERFGEAALLLLISRGQTHGYELLEQLPSVVGDERVDVGNVYRALRALEEDGLVHSEWSAELPGPAKRTYTLTPAGHAVLGAWLRALESLQTGLTDFLELAQTKGGDDVQETRPQGLGVARAEP